MVAMGDSRKEELEAIREQLDSIKGLLDRIAVRNGLRP